MVSIDIPKTFGALLLGGLFAAVLSGFVGAQSIIYSKLYPTDPFSVKALVLAIWLLDSCHTGFIWAALWQYLIMFFGEPHKIDFISWNIALTIFLTAVLTFVVHCFFSHRIFMLSQRNWILTLPIFMLAVLRLVSACATTVQMINLHSFSQFKEDYRWLFTMGLALSSVVDILITCSLFFLLQKSRTGAKSLNKLIDTLIWYSFETGTLTTAGTILSMVCYLSMNTNLIFMGMHFVISKFYANSLLVTLNTRQTLRHSHTTTRPPVPQLAIETRYSKEFSLCRTPADSTSDICDPSAHRRFTEKLEINVEQSVEYVADADTDDSQPAFHLHV